MQTANDPLATAGHGELRSSLRTYTRKELPEAMVPGHFVILPELPTLPNGKVDRTRLPAVEPQEGPAAHVPPRTPVQHRIAALWRDVLGVSEIGIEDSFFDLGGNSLTAVQMVSTVREEYDVPLSMRRLFQRPTIAELAALVEGDAETSSGPVGDSRSIGPEQLAAEASLPDDVRPDHGCAAPATAPYRAVLLTGATGFTGAFLLRELLDRSTARIHLLVRAKDAATALARVRRNLEAYGLWRNGDAKRLVGVPGDLGRPYFGMAHASYRELAATVETIVHNGSWSSFVLPYARLKPINVLGTLEILRLACRARRKPVHYVSSLAVFPGHREVKHFDEVELSDPDGVVGGYPQTKWVADRLVMEAGHRGLPVAVYRPGQITGAQDTGAAPTELFVCAMMKSCIQLGAAPDPDMLVEMVPVDFVAAAIAHIALSGNGFGRAHHLPSSKPVHWIEMMDMFGACGYPVRRVPYQDWYRLLNGAVRRGEDNALAPFLPLLGEDGPSEDLAYQNGSPHFVADNLAAATAGTGIQCPPVTVRLLDTYLRYFTSIGYIPGPSAT